MRWQVALTLACVLSSCKAPPTPTTRPKPQPPAKAKPSPRTAPTPAPPDRSWVKVAQEQLRAARKARETRLAEQARRVGSLSEMERKVGLAVAQRAGKVGTRSVSPELLDEARQFAPEYIEALQRLEARYRPRRGQGVGDGPSPADRDRFEAVTKAIGPLDRKYPLNPFFALSDEEQVATVILARKAAQEGLASLSTEERQRLLDVGALQWFGKQLVTGGR